MESAVCWFIDKDAAGDNSKRIDIKGDKRRTAQGGFMQLLDYLILAAVLGPAALALRFLYRHRSGCGSCHGCGGRCAACPAKGKGGTRHADAP